MDNSDFSSFRELRENINRFMHGLFKNAQSAESQALDLNTSQIHVILLLRKNKFLSMSKLTNHTNVVKSSMTNIVDSLEKLELVYRFKNDNDRRAVFVSLTESGIEIANGLRTEITNSFKIHLNNLNQKEKDVFFNSIQNLSSLFYKMENKNEK